MMETKEFLSQLANVADSSQKRVDTYIKMSQSFLKDSPEWNEQYDLVFQEMLREIQVSRKIKNVAVSAIIVLTILLILVSSISYFMSKRKASDIALIESARNAQLALRFRGVNDHGLEVTVDPDAVSDPNIKDRMQKILADFPALGRHYGLGLNKLLKLQHEEDYKWLILPESGDSSQVLGYIKFSVDLGKIDFLNKRVELNEEIRFEEVDNFYIKIISYKRRNPDIPDDVEWQVVFGEKQSNGLIVWNEEAIINVNQSLNGNRIKDPIMLGNPKWKNIYMVSIGIGKLGTDPTNNKDYAWNLRSYVRNISLN